MNANVRVDAAALTHPGMRRRVNEDSVFAGDPVFVVADGMGGHEAGDRASAAAVAVFADLAELAKHQDLTHVDVEAALDRARDAVAEVAAGTERGGGCTLTGVVRITHDGLPLWHVFNIGDSRVYEFFNDELRQLTRDHSLHLELLEQGHTDAANTPRNVITRALGSEDARHDAWLLPVRAGSRIVVCSDGLTNEITDQHLANVLGAEVEGFAVPPADVVERLVADACAVSGRDNITVIVVDTLWADGVPVPPPASEAVDDGGDDTEETLDVTIRVDRGAQRGVVTP